MESVDKLRGYCDKLARVDDNCVSAEYVAERCAIDVRGMADAIEREVAERYMELPVDADGVPWHIGDMVEGHGKVHSLDLNRHGWSFFGVENAIDPAIHRHAKPRTVEDAARDFVNSVVTLKGHRDGIPVVGIDDSLWRDYFPEYADELRELVGVDE